MIADEACAERGCPMHDSRDGPGVPMVELDPYRTKVRNETLEEVAQALEAFHIPFGQDTINSFATFVREMKRGEKAWEEKQ